MSNTTRANVLAIAPELSTGITDDQWTLILSDVADEITISIFKSRQEIAQRYLAAHKLTLVKTGGSGEAFSVGSISSKSVGDVSVSYAVSTDKNNPVTKYEAEFNKIKNKLILCFAVYPAI